MHFNIAKLYHIYNFPFLLKIISLGYFVDYKYLPKLSLIVVHLEFNGRSGSSQDVVTGGLNLTYCAFFEKLFFVSQLPHL